MNRLAHWMMRLYPARWRRRYGEEVTALVDDTGADMLVLADLFKGALFMQFSTWSFPRLAAVLGLAGMLAGFGVSMLSPAAYIARTALTLTGTDSRGATMQVLWMETTTRPALSIILNDPRLLLYKDQLRTIPLEDVIRQMRNDISLHLDGDKDIIIQFAYPERIKAEMAVRELAQQAVRNFDERSGFDRLAGPQPPFLEVTDTANLPSRPLRPNPWLTASIGLAAGCLIAIVWFVSARFVFFREVPGLSRTALILAITGTLAGAAMSWVVPSIAGRLPEGLFPLRYESHATLYEADNTIPLGDLVEKVSSRTSMAAMIVDPRLRLYSAELNRHSLDEVAAAMQRDVAITERGSGPGERWLNISFTYADPLKAQQAVQAIMIQAEDEFRRSVSQRNPPRRQLNRGTIAGPPSPVTIDNLATGRATPMLTGFVVGLCLAAIIAIVRQRWTGDEEYAPPHTPPTPMLSARHFRKLAPWLTITGAVGGLLFAWITPGRYTSEAVLAFESEPPSDAAKLIDDAVNLGLPQIANRQARRNLSWEQLEADNTRTSTFRFRFIATTPEIARDVLQDVLGEIDRAVVRRQGAFIPSFEEIRGVDGALLPVPPEDLKPQRDPYAESLSVAAGQVFTGSITMSVLPIAVPVAASAIPFDDDRARPVARPPGAEIRMDVIDRPAVLSSSDGMGLWAIAIGAASGLFLSWLLSVPGNTGRWFGQKRSGIANPSY